MKDLYQGAFPNIIICGPEKSDKFDVLVVEIEKGFWGYECLGRAARENPGYRGYLYINDDMIVNWWNLVHLDRDMIWQGSRIDNEKGIEIHQPVQHNWPWWWNTNGFEKCKLAIQDVKEYEEKRGTSQLINNLRINGNGKLFCLRGWSDLFYIPGRLRETFADVSNIFFKRKVFLEIAVPVMESLLCLRNESVKLNGVYLPDTYGEINYGSSFVGWNEYNMDITFLHPFKLHGDNREINENLLKNWVIKTGQGLTVC